MKFRQKMKSEQEMKAGCFFENLAGNLAGKFAEDSAGKSSVKISLLGTLFLWILLLVFGSFVLRIKKTPEYKTINLVLETPSSPSFSSSVSASDSDFLSDSEADSVIQENRALENNDVIEKTEVPEKTEALENRTQKTLPSENRTESSKIAVAEKKSLPSSNSAVPKTENAAQSSKTSDSKNAGVPQKKQNIVYKKSTEELMAEQLQKKADGKQAVWDDSLFGSDSASAFQEESSSSEKNVSFQKSISGTDAFSGTAGISSGGEKNLSARSEPDSESRNSSSKALESTSASLNKIASASSESYRQTFSDSFSAQTTVSAVQNADGRVEMKMNDGSSRILLDPEKPSIIISKENGALIDSQRTVEISFRILSGGNVLFSAISFSPSAALPVAIQSEIKEQVSLWRFSPASSESQAKFVLEIKKR